MTSPSDSLLAASLEFVAEVNRGDATAALAWFTDDAVIVMDLPPYRLEGAGAGPQWLTMMGAHAAALGMTAVALHPAAPRRVEADDKTGYIILPGVLKLDGGDRHLTAQGELTLAARRADSGWKFCAMTWAGGEPA